MPKIKDGGYILDENAEMLTEEQFTKFKRLMDSGKEDEADKYLDAIIASWELPKEERKEIQIR